MTNGLIENNFRSLEPEVGMGATELLFSDRHAYTVIEVIDENTIRVQQDKAIRIDNNGMSDMQDYRYERDTTRWPVTLHRSPDGHWRTEQFKVKRKSYPGEVFMLGRRDEHHDYSF